MAILGWLTVHGFDALQTTSILVGLFATVHTLRADVRVRKIQNLFAITAAHRELWTRFSETPALHRIFDLNIDLGRHPVSIVEQRFVHGLILHLRASFKARKAGMEFDDDALVADVRDFFAGVIPRTVWEQSRVYQDADFVAFVERCIALTLSEKEAATS